MSKKQQISLLVISYLGWFGCVFSGKYELGILSYIVPFLFLAVYGRTEKLSLSQTLVFFIITIIGLSFDTLALSKGWITMLQPQSGILPPHWLISLWLLFAFSIPLYHVWLKEKYLFSGGLGFFIGPITYFSGVKLGVLQMDQWTAFLYYAIFWGVFFPFCFLIYSVYLKLKFK